MAGFTTIGTGNMGRRFSRGKGAIMAINTVLADAIVFKDVDIPALANAMATLAAIIARNMGGRFAGGQGAFVTGHTGADNVRMDEGLSDL